MAYTLPTQRKGDTFDGLEITVQVNAAPSNITGAAIRMDFWPKGKPTEITKRLEVGSGITITNGAGGVFVVDPFLCDLPAGQYNTDIRITYPSGRVKTYVDGDWLIEPDNK